MLHYCIAQTSYTFCLLLNSPGQISAHVKKQPFGNYVHTFMICFFRADGRETNVFAYLAGRRLRFTYTTIPPVRLRREFHQTYCICV